MSLVAYYSNLEQLYKDVEEYEGNAWDAFCESEDFLYDAELAKSRKDVKRLSRKARLAERDATFYRDRVNYTRAYIDGYLKALEVLESWAD